MPVIVDTIEELIAGATGRREVHPDDGKSGSAFETLRIDGRRRFLKVVSYQDDWIMRVTGNVDHWEHKVWRGGIYDRLPPSIDHAIVAMALDTTGPAPRLGILMDDCGAHLIPQGDDPVAELVHVGLIESMAAMHAALWGWDDDLGLGSMTSRLRFFAPETIASELERPAVPAPVAAAREGWARLADRAPGMATVVRSLHREPAALLEPLARTPVTFVSGDWKMGNLGRRPDGRTILLDQAYPGSAPPCWDLLWYLALNRQRLPESKEATIDRYRAALVACEVPTSDWWEAQLALTIIGMMTCFGWEKALGDDDELRWWEHRVMDAGSLLG